jgi:hypothetical protein
MARIKEYPHLFSSTVPSPEAEMVKAMVDAASKMEDVLYYRAEFDGSLSDNPAEVKNLLDAVYRPLRKAIEFYYGPDDNPLTYRAPAPGKPFAKPAK